MLINIVMIYYKTFRKRCSLQTVTITNCCDVKLFSVQSEVYKLNKKAFSSIDAYCKMDDGEEWIVIQRNKKNSQVSFNRNWAYYEEGIGDLNTEFWYGLKNIHSLASVPALCAGGQAQYNLLRLFRVLKAT